jgi:hypothetical protein
MAESKQEGEGLVLQIGKLHLFPGTLYAIGAALFAAGLVRANPSLGFWGAGAVFLAVGINMLTDYTGGWKKPVNRQGWIFVTEIFVALILAAAAFGLAWCHPCQASTLQPRHVDTSK